MKLQTTAANKEDDYDFGEDEDQPESEDNDSKFRLTYWYLKTVIPSLNLTFTLTSEPC